MTMPAIQIPGEYSYVLLAASSTWFVAYYHTFLTGSSRKAAGVEYPKSYANDEVMAKNPKAYVFNCAQRAQTNFTEVLAPYLTVLLVSGLRFPITSALLGGAWTLSRTIYAFSYVRNGPKGRIVPTTFHSLINISLTCMSVYSCLKFIISGN